MRTTTNDETGYTRVWLHSSERKKLVNTYDDQPVKQLAIRLMLQGGLRADEVRRVTAQDIQQSEDGDFQRLKLTGKTGSRTTTIPDSLAQQIKTVNSIQGDNKPVVDVTTRTVQNWVETSRERLHEETGNKDWLHLSAHDLRRTWATSLIQQGVPESNVMTWGGWDDYSTFKEHYFNESDAEINKSLQQVDFFS